jgi:hypothetical protein
MTKLRYSAFSMVLLALLQAGCAATPARPYALRPSTAVAVPRPACDTSVQYIGLVARIRNGSSGSVGFNLVGDRGPPFNLWYMGYRVYSSAPGEPFRLVHDSGQDWAWTRKLAIAPGDSADFNVPIFGLRPADYYRYFRIEVRDSNGIAYWTPVFELCAVSRPSCGCPRVGAVATGAQLAQQACPAAPGASAANFAAQVEVAVDCK